MKAFLKRAVYSVAYAIYKVVWKYPRIMSMLYRLNSRFHLVSSKGEAQQLYRSTAKLGKAGWREIAGQKPLRRARDIKVAAVMDEFTFNSFKYECNLIPVEPNDWLDVFQKEQPDIFLCESAWSGADAARRPWLGKVYTSNARRRETREALLSILDYCKDHRIPTVFWNKEDPTYFDDKVHNFIDTAVRFDYVFTTDSSCVERYKKEYGHKHVSTLMFATQPRLFNPIETCERTEDVAFAGSWYANHIERCRDMAAAFDKILESGHGLVIYNRNNDDDPNHVYPEKYWPYLRPPLVYQQMDRAYKGSKYALNITTVTESDTMFARRVFELMSSNTLVITNYSRGIDQLFGDTVLFTDRDWDFARADEMRRRNLQTVLAGHTYEARFRQILDDIGYPHAEDLKAITLIYIVDDEDGIKRALDAFGEIAYVHKRCMLLLSERVSPVSIKDLHNRYQPTSASIQSAQYCLTTGELPALESEYFIFVGAGLDPDFPAKAVLHFSYLDPDVSVHSAAGAQYAFAAVETLDNRLFHGAQYENVFRCRLFNRPCDLRSFGI